MPKTMLLTGRAVGVLCGAGTSAAWAFAMWVPSAGLTLSGISLVVALIMTLLSLFAAIAAVRGHAAVLVLVFLASFFPVGLFLINVEHWLRWVGYADIGFLVSGLLMRLGARAIARVEPSTT